MKAHKIHPSPLKRGYKRETIIEFNYREFDGLMQVINESVKYLDKDKKILLDFQNAISVDSPSIQCIYTPKDGNEKIS